MKMFAVLPAANATPLAFFGYKNWAEEWAQRYCMTGLIVEMGFVTEQEITRAVEESNKQAAEAEQNWRVTREQLQKTFDI